MGRFSFRKQQEMKWYEAIDRQAGNTIYSLMTTRQGGISQSPFSSLNMATHVGDDFHAVIDNRNRLLNVYGIDVNQAIAANQVHGNEIAIVTREHAGMGSNRQPMLNVDGLITCEQDIALMSFYADCVPLYFWDQEHKVIALAHAGWRGTVLNIAGKMIDTFVSEFQSRPENIKVVIGVSICGKCYRINEQVRQQFADVFTADELRSILTVDSPDQYLLDLRQANQKLLERQNISKDNIVIMSDCTYCNNDLFFSYRKEQGMTGRMASIIFQRDER